MTALSIHQRCAAIPYGAAELKQAYYKNFGAALLISVSIHILIVAAYYLAPAFPEERPRDVGDEGRERHVTIIPQPPISQPKEPGFQPNTSEYEGRGTVVPVEDNPVSLEKTLAPQGDMNPVSVLPGEGTGGGNGIAGTGGETVRPIEEPEGKELYMVEKEPIIVLTKIPVYPPLALKSELEGKVWIKILVGKDGTPVKAVVLKSTHEIFEEAALQAAREFVFTPGYMSSGPVAVWVSVPFSFRLSSAR